MANIFDKFNKSKSGWTFGGSADELKYRKKGDFIRGGEGGAEFFEAGDDWTGDLSANYGGTFSFRLRQDGSGSTSSTGAQIRIEGANGVTLTRDFDQSGESGWNTFEFRLDQVSGWRVDGRSIASVFQIQEVLEDVTSVKIRADSRSDDSFTDLDEVRLSNGSITEDDTTALVENNGIKSDFKFGADGWSFINDVRDFNRPNSGGEEDGYLQAVDLASGLIMYYVAPSTYEGVKSGFFGGSLSFSLIVETFNPFAIKGDDVQFIGANGTTIVYNLPNVPGSSWTKYLVTLDSTTDWRLESGTGAVASDADIQSVLDNVAGLWIRGEFVNGPETTGIDNVVMSAPSLGRYVVVADEQTGNLRGSTEDIQDAFDLLQDGDYLQVGRGIEISYDATITKNDVSVNGGSKLSAEFKLGKGVQDFEFFQTGEVVKIKGNGLGNEITVGLNRGNPINEAADLVDVRGGGGDDVISAAADSKTGTVRLNGGAGDDILIGGRSGDTLKGGDDNDTLVGGRGNDRLTGGSGEDTFIIEQRGGRDTITDFETGIDSLVIAVPGVASLDDFVVGKRGENLMLSTDTGVKIVFKGYRAFSELDPSDIEFRPDTPREDDDFLNF